jgi:hypothetical protein
MKLEEPTTGRKYWNLCEATNSAHTTPNKYNRWYASELNIEATNKVMEARKQIIKQLNVTSHNQDVLRNLRSKGTPKRQVNYALDYVLHHMSVAFSAVKHPLANRKGVRQNTAFVSFCIGSDANTFNHCHTYYRCKMSQPITVRLLEELEKQGYIYIHLGAASKVSKYGQPTVYSPMPKLGDMLVQDGIIARDLISTSNKKSLVYITNEGKPNTPVLDDESELILNTQNALLAATVIDLPITTHADFITCYEDTHITGDKIRRVYSKQAGNHGRFYHGYSGCPSRYRKLITFDGEPTVELDYQASQVHVAYSRNGLNAGDGDPYVPTLARPVLRPIYKALLLRSFTSINPIGTVWTDDEINTSDISLTDMLEEIWQMHSQIANHRHKEAHKTITYQESRICLKVIELCNEQGITVLPIHDSMIVKKQHKQTLKDMMVKAYKVIGFVSVPKVTGG